MNHRKTLEDLAAGRISIDDAARAISVGAPIPGHVPDSGLLADGIRPDHGRRDRTGIPEVVFGQNKSVEETVYALRALSAKGRGAFATRVPADQRPVLESEFPEGRWHDRARIFELEDPGKRVLPGAIAVVSAGTSDAPVAEEAAATAEFLGSRVIRAYDVGVAGLHRVLERRGELAGAAAVVVVAGMEGALPSVVGGLVPSTVIAVPTSVGYGAAYGGIAALLGMLNSCAAGVVVVNIDNGFGAAVAAHRIHRASVRED